MPKATSQQHELVIIGAGPAGLAAALYAAREGIDTVVIEKGVVGGLAAITATIDNYPGFDNSIGGLELAERLAAHATRFGAHIQTGLEVTRLAREQDRLIITTPSGSLIADAVLIATGSTYKQLGVPGEAAMIGRGVHFCATCDAPLYRNKDLLVAGGGNSAIQESLFIARFARHLTLLVREPELEGTEVLRKQLESLKNVKVQYNTQIKRIHHDGAKLTGVDIVDSQSHKTNQITADGLFVFIGLLANTAAFTKTISLDAKNFIITQPDYSTSLDGVYAAGDVRSGSTWQIASAIGEGVSAALSIRAYLQHLHHRRRHAAKQTVLQ